MLNPALEKHLYQNGTKEQQRVLIRSKFTKKSQSIAEKRRSGSGCAEIEHSIEQLKMMTQVQKIRTISSHTKCMTSFHGSAIQCIGLRNGSISIGDWFHDERYRSYDVSVKHKKMFDQHGSVKRLMYHAGHIMIGLIEGTVLFFDTMHNAVVQKEFFHRSPVIFLGISDSTQQLFSVSANGHIVSYSAEKRIPENEGDKVFPVLKETYLDSPLSAFHISDKHLISGFSNGVVSIIDATNLGTQYAVIRANDKGIEITALCKSYGLLAVGQLDGRILLYETSERSDRIATLLSKIIHYHESAIVSLYFDRFSKTHWSADANGSILTWDSSSTTNHAIRSFQNIGESIRDISFEEISHSSQFWTVSSTGSNICWWTSTNKASEKVDQAAAMIENEIASKQGDLQLGFSNIDGVERVQEGMWHRYGKMTVLLTERRLLSYYYWHWRRHLQTECRLRRLNVQTQTALRNIVSNVRYDFWRRLVQIRAFKRRNGLEAKLKEYRRVVEARNVASVHFHTWHQFSNSTKEKSVQMMQLRRMSSLHDRWISTQYYRKFVLYSKLVQIKIRAQSIGEHVQGREKMFALRAIYDNLCGLRQKYQNSMRLESISTILQKQYNLVLIAPYLKSLQECRDKMLKITQLDGLASVITRRTNKKILRNSYHKFCTTITRNDKGSTTHENTALVTTLEQLRQRVRVLEIRKQNEKINDMLLVEYSKLEQSQKAELQRVECLKESLSELREKIDEIEYAHADRGVTDQLVETMSLLKSKALNFDSDFLLIQKTVDRASSMPGHGALRIFLSAHLDVKRVIVSVLGEQPKKRQQEDYNTDLTCTWGTSKENILLSVRQFPLHTHAVLLEAIKKMVISFDMLPPEDLSSIDTDDEIVANATGLITMFEYLVELRSKKAAHRFK